MRFEFDIPCKIIFVGFLICLFVYSQSGNFSNSFTKPLKYTDGRPGKETDGEKHAFAYLNRNLFVHF